MQNIVNTNTNNTELVLDDNKKYAYNNNNN